MQPEAVIYLSDQRGITKSRAYQSLHSLNFGSYQKPNRNPFKNLAAFNDDTVQPQSALEYSIPASHLIFVLPIIGGIEFNVNESESNRFVEAGQSVLIAVENAASLNIINPFSTGPVNFVCCWFSGHTVKNDSIVISPVDVVGSENTLIGLFSTESVKARIGKFSGRKDYILKLDCDNSGVFAFVVEGAFEFQHILLQSKDGLSIYNVSQVEFEALSNDAMILVFDF